PSCSQRVVGISIESPSTAKPIRPGYRIEDELAEPRNVEIAGVDELIPPEQRLDGLGLVRACFSERQPADRLAQLRDRLGCFPVTKFDDFITERGGKGLETRGCPAWEGLHSAGVLSKRVISQGSRLYLLPGDPVEDLTQHPANADRD